MSLHLAAVLMLLGGAFATGGPVRAGFSAAGLTPLEAAQEKGKGKEKEKGPEVRPVQVTGQVVDRQGSGLVNIDVTAEGQNVKVAKKSGQSGAFSFELPPGKYRVSAKSGNAADSFEIAITGETHKLKQLVLKLE